MNILEQLEVKKTPFIFAYDPKKIVISEREISVLPALVSELVDMSIDKVTPIERVGSVMLFDVTPHQRQDPPLITDEAAFMMINLLKFKNEYARR